MLAWVIASGKFAVSFKENDKRSCKLTEPL
jgi:hypothetical protein